MSVQREAKNASVEDLRQKFARMSSAVLVDFKGVDVATVSALRREFRKVGVEYKVVKNTLIMTALKGTAFAGNEAVARALRGQTGVAWSYEDPSAAAKVIKAFRRGERAQKIVPKAALLEGQLVAGDRVEAELALMPGKDECRAMLLATFLAPATEFVKLLMAAPQNFAYLLDARHRGMEPEG